RRVHSRKRRRRRPAAGASGVSSDRDRDGRWLQQFTALGVAAAIAFDVATILPTLAGLHVIKRAVRTDTFEGTDMLPDDLIEGALAWAAHLIARGL
ncbi:hypothetical protein, partial [Roseomonas sp. BN140053]|uniref:hypothetical protein n=1 Tax=Roseomonas sp. BN140053 TaxID=3391898 RepID=UPI0039ED91BF